MIMWRGGDEFYLSRLCLRLSHAHYIFIPNIYKKLNLISILDGFRYLPTHPRPCGQ